MEWNVFRITVVEVEVLLTFEVNTDLLVIPT